MKVIKVKVVKVDPTQDTIILLPNNIIADQFRYEKVAKQINDYFIINDLPDIKLEDNKIIKALDLLSSFISFCHYEIDECEASVKHLFNNYCKEYAHDTPEEIIHTAYKLYVKTNNDVKCDMITKQDEYYPTSISYRMINRLDSLKCQYIKALISVDNFENTFLTKNSVQNDIKTYFHIITKIMNRAFPKNENIDGARIRDFLSENIRTYQLWLDLDISTRLFINNILKLIDDEVEYIISKFKQNGKCLVNTGAFKYIINRLYICINDIMFNEKGV